MPKEHPNIKIINPQNSKGTYTVSPATGCTLLFFAANPKDSEQLELTKEFKVIQQKRIESAGDWSIHPHFDTTPKEILPLLLPARQGLKPSPKILHFSGHGIGSNGLMFTDEKGYSKLVTGEALANMLRNFSDSVSCVVLNACYSDEQARIIAEYIPNVIGTDNAIGDDKAREFSAAFYLCIFRGESYDRAFRIALAQVGLQGLSEGAQPVLYRWADSQVPKNKEVNKSQKAKSTYDIAYLNCDRTKIQNSFEINFEKLDTRFKVHHYFLVGQKLFQANSLVKRLITIAEQDKARNNLRVRFRGKKEPLATQVNASNDGGMEAEDFSILLRRSIGERLNIKDRSLKELIKNIKTYPHLSPYDYIPVVVRVVMEKACWEDYIQESLDWLINTFCEVPEDSDKVFLFFLIFELQQVEQTSKKGLFSRFFGKKKAPQKEFDLQDNLKTFTKNIPNATTLPELTLITRKDLEDWFADNGFETNEVIINERVDKLVAILGPPIKYVGSKGKKQEGWKMAKVERELKKIVREHNIQKNSI